MLKWEEIRARIILFLLFIILTLVYFRYVIFSPADALVTRNLATDLYGHFAHVHEQLEWLKQGFIGVGDHWVPRGGGFPAANNDQLIIPQEFLLMIFYALTGSLTFALKIVDFLFYLLSLITSYWYGTTIFKRKDASIVFAVAYSFSMYGVNQLEHLELIGVPFLIMLTLIFLEKAFEYKKPTHILLTGLFTFLVLLSNLYALVFLLFFLVFRFAFQLITEKTRQFKIEVIKYFLLLITILSLLGIPYILPYINTETMNYSIFTRGELGYPTTGEFVFSQPPYLYFLRNVPSTSTEIHFMYLGVSVSLLAVLPIILNYRNKLYKTYIFHLSVALFFFIYSIGQYSPINIAMMIHDYLPLTSFIRVPGRALMIGYLNFSICAGIGYIALSDLISSHAKAKNLEPNPRHTIGLVPRWSRADTSQKKLAVILLLVTTVIFLELTPGFEPPTMPMTLLNNNTYNFIKQQPGNFRILEIPSVHDQQAMTYIYTGHDTLNPTLWAYGLFIPLYNFTELYFDYLKFAETTHQSTPNNIDHAIAMKSAFYGVKYILLNTDPTYYKIFSTAPWFRILDPVQIQNIKTHLNTSNDYKLVYSDRDTYIYENLRYRGNIFLTSSGKYNLSDPFYVEDANASIQYFQTDPNTMTIDIENQEPVSVIISQSFSDGWVATIEDELPDGSKVTKTQSPSQIAAIQYIPINNSGKYKITLHYWHYESSLLLYPIFYIPLGIITIALSFKQLRQKKKNLLRFILLPLAIYGVMLTLFATRIYPSLFPKIFQIYHMPILSLGTALAILPILIYLLTLISRRLNIFV